VGEGNESNKNKKAYSFIGADCDEDQAEQAESNRGNVGEEKKGKGDKRCPRTDNPEGRRNARVGPPGMSAALNHEMISEH